MLDNYFNYKKYKTDFRTEVVAGVSTFLTMAYIMFLNPVILADGGFDFGGVFTATALATAIACFIAAFYAKTWPVGLAPGMGINAFVAYGVCLGMEYTPAEALGAVLVAGVVFLIISLTPIRAWLINSIPKSLKLGIGAGIGLFLAIIGFEIMISKPIIAKNKPIPAPIPNFKLFGIEFINQALIGVRDIIKNTTPATNTAPSASAGVYSIPRHTPYATKAFIPIPGAKPTGQVFA